MSDSKKLSIGKELTDDELMEMTGGSKFQVAEKGIILNPAITTLKYGINPGVVAKYGVQPLYGVKPVIEVAQPLYGIMPTAKYGILTN